MASLQKSDRDEPLNDSWVELQLQGQLSQQSSQPGTGYSSPQPAMKPLSIHNSNMEKLLMEAQKEWSSRSTSRTTSDRGSPKSPHSPNTEVASEHEFTTDTTHIYDIREEQVKELKENPEWIWDWSSRIEAQPPSEWSGRFKHPPRKSKLSVRNTKVMSNKGIFCLDNLPTLLLSHACTFFLGAAVMFIYLKKYCGMVATATTD